MTVYTSSTQHYCDTSCGLKEFGFSQGYTGLYPRISGYIDLRLVQRAVTNLRYETCLPIEDHQQQWDCSNNWNSQLNYSKDQTESPHIWKSSLTGKVESVLYSVNHSSPLFIKKGHCPGHSKEVQIIPSTP